MPAQPSLLHLVTWFTSTCGYLCFFQSWQTNKMLYSLTCSFFSLFFLMPCKSVDLSEVGSLKPFLLNILWIILSFLKHGYKDFKLVHLVIVFVLGQKNYSLHESTLVGLDTLHPCLVTIFISNTHLLNCLVVDIALMSS